MKSRLDFNQWPTDLLIDYALKVHHRTIREVGPTILYNLQQLAESYSSLNEVVKLFNDSLLDLEEHLMKEENILFPLISQILYSVEHNEAIGQFHCGTVQNPISVMMSDHLGETSRHSRIAELTNNYTAPVGCEPLYQDTLDALKEFKDALEEHIFIEDELIFPRAISLEEEIRS